MAVPTSYYSLAQLLPALVSVLQGGLHVPLDLIKIVGSFLCHFSPCLHLEGNGWDETVAVGDYIIIVDANNRSVMYVLDTNRLDEVSRAMNAHPQDDVFLVQSSPGDETWHSWCSEELTTYGHLPSPGVVSREIHARDDPRPRSFLGRTRAGGFAFYTLGNFSVIFVQQAGGIYRLPYGPYGSIRPTTCMRFCNLDRDAVLYTTSNSITKFNLLARTLVWRFAWRVADQMQVADTDPDAHRLELLAHTLAISPCCRYFVASTHSDDLILCSLETGKEIGRVRHHKSAVELHWLPNNQLWVQSGDSTMSRYSIE